MSRTGLVSSNPISIGQFDWASTELGPRSSWADQLSQAVELVLADPAPAIVMWGTSLHMLHNEPFASFAGQGCPDLMGKSAIVEGKELWPMLADVLEAARNDPKVTRHPNVAVTLARAGAQLVCFVTYVFVPLLDKDQAFRGFYLSAIDTTDQVLATRRSKTLLSVWDAIALSRTTRDYWHNLTNILRSHNEDLCWVFAYSFRAEPNPDNRLDLARSKSVGSRPTTECFLSASTIDATGQMPKNISLETSEDLFARLIIRSVEDDEVTVLDYRDSDDLSWIFKSRDGSESKEACRTVVIIPVRPTTRIGGDYNNALGFLVVGISPRLIYDDDFAQFIRQFMRQIGTSSASVMLSEHESRRHDRLEQQLEVSRRHAEDFELRLSRFVEVSNIGMWIASPNGQLLFANKAWYSQAELPYNTQGMAVEKWVPLVAEDSRPNFMRHWEMLVADRKPVIFECKFKALWRSPDPVTGEMREGPRWFLISAAPEFHEDGTLKSSWGCNVDVSYQKWAQSVIDDRLKESVEAKRQTDNFIDLISHEIRNPLSAILQSADGIAATMTDAMKGKPEATGVTLGLEDTLSINDLASIVVTCAQHQKRIVDDVLTLSKLDASLLEVTPDEVDPVAIIQDALKLHLQEFKNAAMEGSMKIDQSYHSLQIDRVLLDPSRLMQVLINLLTNAIKFTRSEPIRRVVVHLAATSECPEENSVDAYWFAPRRSTQVQHDAEDGTHEGDLYLWFAIEDTGCGLSDDGMRRLFTKFSQATPKTHVQYGGSGLGLFICKELTELQGGRIGVTSTLGRGSTFKFFIKVHRATSGTDSVAAKVDQLKPLLLHSQEIEALVQDTSRMESSLEDTNSVIKAVHAVASTEIYSSTEEQLHILVVEDNLINQKVMANQLRRANCIVYTADDGADALDFLRQTNFWLDSAPDAIPLSIVLMDLEMPVMDGLTCISKIRELEKLGDITRPVPTIAITANARWEQVKRALDYGMNDVATKPLRIKDLLPRIRNLVKPVPV